MLLVHPIPGESAAGIPERAHHERARRTPVLASDPERSLDRPPPGRGVLVEAGGWAVRGWGSSVDSVGSVCWPPYGGQGVLGHTWLKEGAAIKVGDV